MERITNISKNSFQVVGLDHRGAIVLRQKWSRGQIETRLANMAPCLIGTEACVGASPEPQAAIAWSRRAPDVGEIRDKNDFRDGKAIAEAPQRPTMKFAQPERRNRHAQHLRRFGSCQQLHNIAQI